MLLLRSVAACSPETRAPTSAEHASFSVTAPQTAAEGELLGNLYVNGQPITDSSYLVLLTPDVPTGNRLKYFDGSMWVSPTYHNTQHWMFSWFDPRHGGPCGNEFQYVSGDTINRGSEVHWSSPTTPPSGKEKHCIQPGRYTLTIFHGEQISREIVFDYVPVKGFPGGSALSIWDATAGVWELIEEQNYDDTTYFWSDVIVNADVGTPGYSDLSVLYADSAGADPYANTTFTNASSLAGSQYTFFRFSSVASTTTSSGLGRLLSRLYWDATYDLSDRSGFWDSHSNLGVIRIHQFATDSQRTGDYYVGLETMRPDEQPATSPQTTRPISITLAGPPPALSDIISGPDLITYDSTYGWQQTASGGVAPYTYGNWYYYRSPGPETLVGAGRFYSRYVATGANPYVFRLRALVTDQQGAPAQAKYFVEVIRDGGLAAVMATGVRYPDGTCRTRPASGSARQAWLQWVFEQRAGVAELCAPGQGWR